jgi:hypothetical protein
MNGRPAGAEGARRASRVTKRRRLGTPLIASKRSRVGVLIGLLGLGVLAASLYGWAGNGPYHRLYYAEDQYDWVAVDASNAPAIETGKIWRAPADCQLPYFVKAAVQAKAKLKTYNDAAPEEIRALRERADRRVTLQRAPDKTPFDYFVKREQQGRAQDIAGTDYDAELHAKYTEWYVTVSKLEEQVKQWEGRLNDVADRGAAFSETRLASTDRRGVSGTDRDLERRTFSQLGLGGFSDDQQQAIKAACIRVVPVKKIVTRTHYHTDVWRWPFDHVATFWLGLELVLVGALFGPIGTWISTGDIKAALRHARDAAEHFLATANRFVATNMVLFRLLLRRSIRAGVKFVLARLASRGRAGAEADQATRPLGDGRPGTKTIAQRLLSLIVGLLAVLRRRLEIRSVTSADQKNSVRNPQSAALPSSNDHSAGFSQNSRPSLTTNAIMAGTRYPNASYVRRRHSKPPRHRL